MTTKTEERNTAKSQALAQFESIEDMILELKIAQESGDDEKAEQAGLTIQENALSVETRSGWRSPTNCSGESDSEFRLLLCTGGPAVQIVGDLNEYSEPEKPRLQYQDWGTPWTDYPLSSKQEETLLSYCQTYYFGE